MQIDDPNKIKKIVQVGLIFLLFLIIVLYASNRTAPLSQGAELQIENLTNGQVVTNPTLAVEGLALRTIELTINGRIIPTNSEGFFSDTLVLSPGLNTIYIEARDRFGKTEELEYEILYENNEPLTIESLISELQEVIGTQNETSVEENLEEIPAEPENTLLEETNEEAEVINN